MMPSDPPTIYDADEDRWVLVRCPRCGDEHFGLPNNIKYTFGRCTECMKEAVNPYEVIEIGPQSDDNPPDEWTERVYGDEERDADGR